LEKTINNRIDRPVVPKQVLNTTSTVNEDDQDSEDILGGSLGFDQ
jgi:hypothetical protein